MNGLTSFLNKLSKYDWLNVILPGCIAVVLCRTVGIPILDADNWLERIAVYFVYGEVVSRIGGTVVEPLLKTSGFVRFAPYKDYLIFQETDASAGHLIANANMERTMVALGIVIMVLRTYYQLPACEHFRCMAFSWKDVAIVGWVALFVVAYRRQIRFIVKRVEACIEKEQEKK